MDSGVVATERSAKGGPHWQPLRSVIAPQITSQGEHRWPFDGNFPVDVRYWMLGRGPDYPNRYHRYFELLYVYSGSLLYQLEGRSHELKKGDLVVIGGGVLHHAAQQDPVKLVTLFFLPDLFRNWETGGDDLACLTPFLVREPFPHVITGKTRVPQQIFELMGAMYGELPARSHTYELSVKAHLTPGSGRAAQAFFEGVGDAPGARAKAQRPGTGRAGSPVDGAMFSRSHSG